MTKKEALARFREEIMPHVLLRYGKRDRVALAEEWNNWVDYLCSEGQVTPQQRDGWLNPF